nr:helix-turn-helix domain-containing protein [uncultured Flavobacterium sp.]
MNTTIQIFEYKNEINFHFNQPYYSIFLFETDAKVSVNFVEYQIQKNNLLFLAPYQLLTSEIDIPFSFKLLNFHADFYCIEYHRKEVACNGILFNNLFTEPFISLPETVLNEIKITFDKIKSYENTDSTSDFSILKTYLQLILALSNKEKQLDDFRKNEDRSAISPDFIQMVESNFLKQKSVDFYADSYSISLNHFSKKIKSIYGKSPKTLIQERLILESKKQLHLTYKNINEIALYLGFQDEFYFSRFFKKHVGVSPKIFRQNVGIAEIAK